MPGLKNIRRKAPGRKTFVEKTPSHVAHYLVFLLFSTCVGELLAVVECLEELVFPKTDRKILLEIMC
jgi:hypothetical protein